MDKKIACALVSVSDKTGIVEFCRELDSLSIKIISTGGTAKVLVEKNIPVTEVADYTGFPEIMAGRVKTLHPKVHGGILGRRGVDDQVMEAHTIQAIDMVVVNLYPFEQTIANSDCNLAMAIENIDIGGPAMLRSAAKNHADVAVVVAPNDYSDLLSTLKDNDVCLSKERRFALAVKSFAHTAHYDTVIANYLSKMLGQDFPDTLNLQFHHAQALRYGENPHQKAAFYHEENSIAGTITTSNQLQGKELSYNNIADADAALECVKTFTHKPTCVIVKHANPCGAATADSLLEAYDLAYATDPTSAFGGIIAVNQELDLATASEIIQRQFVEVIIAPSISVDAQKILVKNKNIRVLQCGKWSGNHEPMYDFKRVANGLLVQDKDVGCTNVDAIKIVSQRSPTAKELQDLLFTCKVAKFVKSNAIVYGKDMHTIGVGAGQMSRIYSARIANIKAADEGIVVDGSVMASDAFFPFRDGIDAAAEVGITAVIQPGGSRRDLEVIAAADEHNMTMVFTNMRHFKH